MVDGGVDVYLSGEVHDQTVHERDGILQVSHGSLLYRGEASYVLGQATADRLVLENHQFRGEIGFEDRLWTTSREGAPGHISYPDAVRRHRHARRQPYPFGRTARGRRRGRARTASTDETRPACAASRVQGSVTVRARRCARRTLVG